MKNILAILTLSFLVGCITGPDGRKAPHPILTVIAERGAEHGTRAYLRNHPEDAEKFQKATVAIEGKLSNTNRFTGDELGAILQTLPIDAFQGVEGALYVSDVAVIWDTIAQASTRIDGVATDIKPIAAAIARGMRRASQPQAPTPPPPLPAASKYSQAEKDVMGTNYMFRKTAMARFAPAAFVPASDGDIPIMNNPFMSPAYPPFPATFYASAWQPPGHELVVEYQYQVGGEWHEALVASCWGGEQPLNWVVSIYGQSPQINVRGRHVPCVPASAAALNNTISQPITVKSVPVGGLIGLQLKEELTGPIRDTPWFRSIP